MKPVNIITAALSMLASCMMTSCIEDEASNAECDITAVSVHADNALTLFFNSADTMQHVASTDSVITFTIRTDSDSRLTALAPLLTLTEGATVTPASGTAHDFTKGPAYYTVTSEDRMWTRRYRIDFRTVGISGDEDFENTELEPAEQKYYIWHNTLTNGAQGNNWATGNAGFRLSMGTAGPEEYPTAPMDDGYEGKAVKLVTRDTGPFGVMAGKRIAAGNLFLGRFDMQTALIAPRKATAFGVPYDHEPEEMTLWYRYEPGRQWQDSTGTIHADRTDSAAVYAVLYRNHDDAGNSITLDGDNVKTSRYIVAMADMGYVRPTTAWTEVTIPFKYYTTPDQTLLYNRGYSLAIVFSSSSEGDKFCGAIGSTLCVDRLRITAK